MTEPDANEPQGSSVTAVVGTILLVGAIVALPIMGGLWYFKRTISRGEPPSCDRDPVVLEWVERDGSWRRSEAFVLTDDSQTVQVDVALWSDGGVIQFGHTVSVVPAGELFPAIVDDEDVSSTTQPFRGTRVGHGIDAVNEQFTLGAGQWELIVSGGAAPAEVRWPC